jgi:hypothetical protein
VLTHASCIQAHLQTEVRYAHSNFEVVFRDIGYVSEYKVTLEVHACARLVATGSSSARARARAGERIHARRGGVKKFPRRRSTHILSRHAGSGSAELRRAAPEHDRWLSTLLNHWGRRG